MTLRPYSYDLGVDVDLLLSRCAVDAEIFRRKTVFITGGTGFFGVWILSALATIKKRLDGDMRIVALSRDPQKFLARHPPVKGPKGRQCKFLEEWLGVPRYIVTNISRGRSWRNPTA